MNFEHTEVRRMLADALSRFIAQRYDFPTREQAARSVTGYSTELWNSFASLGIHAALFSEADGGFGGAGFDIAVVFEQLGRGLVVEPFLGTLLVGRALSLAGSTAQRTHLAALIDASCVAALAHEEPDSHYEESLVRTQAQRDGEHWLLNGRKAVVQQAEQATLLLVSARVAGRSADRQGLALFLVAAGTPGLNLRSYAKIDGGRAAELEFNDLRLPPQALLGEAGAAYPLLERVLGAGVLALCAEAVGIMDVLCQSTLDYLRDRRQFGVPIGTFQSLRHRMADVCLNVEQARSAVINAAAALDSDDAWYRERLLSSAKHTIGHVGIRCAEEAIQLHGGIGMTWELALSHYAKRLVMIDHQLGDEDHHLQRYISLGLRAPAEASP